MMNETEFQRSGHSAVHLDNYLIIIGGWWDDKELSTCSIWMYNLYTEVWTKHVIPIHVGPICQETSNKLGNGPAKGSAVGDWEVP